MTVLTLTRRIWLILPVIAMAGCGSASIDDAVPGARNTGTYPNLNIPQKAATDQLSDEETRARLAALESTRGAVDEEPDADPSETERLRDLGQSHAQDTLEKIEN